MPQSTVVVCNSPNNVHYYLQFIALKIVYVLRVLILISVLGICPPDVKLDTSTLCWPTAGMK